MQRFILARPVFEFEVCVESISFISVVEVFRSQTQSLDKHYGMFTKLASNLRETSTAYEGLSCSYMDEFQDSHTLEFYPRDQVIAKLGISGVSRVLESSDYSPLKRHLRLSIAFFFAFYFALSGTFPLWCVLYLDAG